MLLGEVVMSSENNLWLKDQLCHCIPIGHHNILLFPNGIHWLPEKSLSLNLNNFFSKHFLKNLNSQKFGNLFIFKLLKFGEYRLKTVTHIFRFLRLYKNSKMEPHWVAIYYL